MEYLQHFVAGMASGACLSAVGYPFDTIKVRMQTNPEFTSVFDCVAKTYRLQGIGGFYRGVTSPLSASVLLNSTLFTSYGYAKNFFPKHSASSNFICGAIAGTAASLVMTPVELFKINAQIQMKGNLYTGPFQCAKAIFQTKGIRGFYRGLIATILRDSLGRGIYFLTYEHLKNLYGPNIQKHQVMIAGGFTGLVVWSAIIPLDTIKSQVQSGNDSWTACYSKIMRSTGIRGFYRGMTPILLRSFPANAASLLGYEITKKFLQ
jgi:hypothetical protein